MAKDDWQAYFQAVRKQDWQSARDVLLQIGTTEKNNPQTYLKIGDICQRTGEKANAIAAYAHASQVLRMQGFVQKALATYKIALRLDPDNQNIISRAEILMEELETVRAKPHALSATSWPQTPEDRKPLLHSSPPETTFAPDWLETTSLAPEKPDAEFPAAGIPSWMETTSLEPEKPAGRIPTSRMAPWLETTSLSPAQQGGPVSGETAEDITTGQPETLPPPPAPAQDELESWLDSAFEALDTRMFLSDDRQTAGTAAGDGASTQKNETGHTAVKSFEDLLFAQQLHEPLRRTYADTQVVIKEGDSGDSLYVIRSGKAKVVAHLLGKTFELAVLGEGDLFGEVGFLTGRPRTASVIAEGPLEVCEITRQDIEKLIESTPDIMAKIGDFYETSVRDIISQMKNPAPPHDLPTAE